MKSSRRLAVWLVAGICAAGSARSLHAADWKAPKDDVVTEKQFTNYCQVQKELMDNLRATGKIVEGSQSSATTLALMMGNNEKFKASLASRGMSMDEYTWVSEKAGQAWQALQIDQMITKANQDFASQRKANEQKLADLKAKLGQYQKAQADGVRVMTKEERDAAITSAKTDEQSALDEAKQHADEVAAAHQELTKAQSDAAAAEALAKNPPADVSADDRAGYIDQKKSEAQSFRDAAKEAKTKEDDAQKAQAESKTKAAAMHNRINKPDLPTSDDDKAEVKRQNDEAIASAKNEIADTERGMKLLEESAQPFLKSLQQNGIDKTPPQNLELLRKHKAEFEQALGLAKPTPAK